MGGYGAVAVEHEEFYADAALATNDGVWRWDGERMQRMAERGQPAGQDVRLLYETGDGQFLAATRSGLTRLDNGSFAHVAGVAEGQDVTALLELPDGFQGSFARSRFMPSPARSST